MNILHTLFPIDLLRRLEVVKRPTPSPWDSDGVPIRERHLVVACSGPNPSLARWARHLAWREYLGAAARSGLLKSPDLVARLTGVDDDGFRSALAECFAAWFFSVRRRMVVRPNPASKQTKNFDLSIQDGPVLVNAEVKAPYVPREHSHVTGDDSSALREAIAKAGDQLPKGQPNVVVLVPLLRTDVASDRNQLLKATIGEPALNIFVAIGGAPPRKPEPTFLQRGKLAKLWACGGGVFRTDLTRVSAVMTLEELLEARGDELRVTRRVVVVHNPFAAVPLRRDFFGRAPQWVTRNGHMRWSDRYVGP